MPQGTQAAGSETRGYGYDHQTDDARDRRAALAAGHTYTQVGERLGVSANTVASHVKNIYRKLEVHSGRAAVWRALELRLLGETDIVPSPAFVVEGAHG